MVGVLIYLDDGMGIFPWVVLSAVIHELGHIVVCLLFGSRVEAIALSAVGAELRFFYPIQLTYGKESLIALAGPAANALLGVAALLFDSYFLSVTSFGLGAFNLLPILPLDGGRVLSNFISELVNPMAADRVLAISEGVLIGILLGIGAVAALNYANIMLLMVSIWLLFGCIRKKNHFSQNK